MGKSGFECERRVEHLCDARRNSDKQPLKHNSMGPDHPKDHSVWCLFPTEKKQKRVQKLDLFNEKGASAPALGNNEHNMYLAGNQTRHAARLV